MLHWTASYWKAFPSILSLSCMHVHDTHIHGHVFEFSVFHFVVFFPLYWTFCSGNPRLDIRVSVFRICSSSFYPLCEITPDTREEISYFQWSDEVNHDPENWRYRPNNEQLNPQKKVSPSLSRFWFPSFFRASLRHICTPQALTGISRVKEGQKFKSLEEKNTSGSFLWRNVCESVSPVLFVLVLFALFMSHTSRSQLSAKFLFPLRVWNREAALKLNRPRFSTSSLFFDL